MTLADSNDAVLDSGAFVLLELGTGTLAAANGLTLDFGGNITGFGIVSTPNNVAKPFINNGHITGDSPAQRITLPGYVKGVGTLDNVNVTGTLAPGLSPTSLQVGNLGLSPTSTLVMELGGTTPGSGYDQLISSGALTFDGALQLALINGFTPAAGQSFNLFDWASASATFDSLLLPTLSSRLTWNTPQLYTTGVISVAAVGVPGDFNNDGKVDAADYVVWRDGLGIRYMQSDYNTWRANFGQTAGDGSDAAVPSPNGSVPEPGLFELLLFALPGRRRRLSPMAPGDVPDRQNR